MTEIDGRSLVNPHPDHPGAECPTCGAPATEWAYPLCTACLVQYSELAAQGEIEQGTAMIRERDERIAELETACEAFLEAMPAGADQWMLADVEEKCVAALRKERSDG